MSEPLTPQDRLTAEPLVEALQRILDRFESRGHGEDCEAWENDNDDECDCGLIRLVTDIRDAKALAARMRAAEPDTVTVRVEDVARALHGITSPLHHLSRFPGETMDSECEAQAAAMFALLAAPAAVEGGDG